MGQLLDAKSKELEGKQEKQDDKTKTSDPRKRIRATQDDLASLQKRAHDLGRELRRTERDVEVQKTAVQTAQANSAALERDLRAQLQRAQRRLHAKVEELRNTRDDAKADLAKLKDEADAAMRQLAQTTADLEEANASAATLQAESDALRKQVDDSNSRLEAAEKAKELGDANGEELAKLRREYQELAEKERYKEDDLVRSGAELARIQAEVDRLKTVIQNNEQLISCGNQATNEVTRLTAEVQTLQQQLASQQQQQAQTTATAQQYQVQAETLAQKVAALTKELETATKRVEEVTVNMSEEWSKLSKWMLAFFDAWNDEVLPNFGLSTDLLRQAHVSREDLTLPPGALAARIGGALYEADNRVLRQQQNPAEANASQAESDWEIMVGSAARFGNDYDRRMIGIHEETVYKLLSDPNIAQLLRPPMDLASAQAEDLRAYEIIQAAIISSATMLTMRERRDVVGNVNNALSQLPPEVASAAFKDAKRMLLARLMALGYQTAESIAATAAWQAFDKFWDYMNTASKHSLTISAEDVSQCQMGEFVASRVPAFITLDEDDMAEQFYTEDEIQNTVREAFKDQRWQTEVKALQSSPSMGEPQHVSANRIKTVRKACSDIKSNLMFLDPNITPDGNQRQTRVQKILDGLSAEEIVAALRVVGDYLGPTLARAYLELTYAQNETVPAEQKQTTEQLREIAKMRLKTSPAWRSFVQFVDTAQMLYKDETDADKEVLKHLESLKELKVR
jgi:predicted  nucleic acid-binding Zn-ribbon protein